MLISIVPVSACAEAVEMPSLHTLGHRRHTRQFFDYICLQLVKDHNVAQEDLKVDT